MKERSEGVREVVVAWSLENVHACRHAFYAGGIGNEAVKGG